MQRIHLSNLDPAHVDPRDHVDREDLLAWLQGGLLAWLRSSSPARGGAFCVLGDKGIGKSILTQRVLSDLREIHHGTTLFVSVDCRYQRDQQDVLREAGSKLVKELDRFRDTIPDAVFQDARSFDALARFDKVSLRHAHKQLTQFNASLDLGGSWSLAKWLETKLGVSMRRSQESVDKLDGEITVDGPRVREAFTELVSDITRHTDLRLILVLDNLEELNHEALLDADEHERVRGEVEGLLHLTEAPLGLILTMRTYYSSVLARRVLDCETLGRLSTSDQRAIFDKRLGDEPDSDSATRARETPEVHDAVRRLAERARTPLAFLIWASFLLSRGLYGDGDIVAALERRLRSNYSAIADDIPAVAALFARPGARVPAEQILAACKNNETLFRSLVENQVLLPHNYWDPREYYLDPELEFLITPASTSA